jgi:hypothetical protein
MFKTTKIMNSQNHLKEQEQSRKHLPDFKKYHSQKPVDQPCNLIYVAG